MKKQIELCKSCLERKNDLKKGIICGLTNNYPDFYNECEKYKINPDYINTEKNKEKSKEKESTENKKLILSFLFLITIVVIELILQMITNKTDEKYSLPFIFVSGFFGFFIITAYFKYGFFYYRFKKAIDLFGENITRKLIIYIFTFFILIIYAIIIFT